MSRQAFHAHPAGRLALLAAITLSLSCGGGSSPLGLNDPDRVVVRVEITPSALVLAEGRTQRLTAQPYNARGVPLPGRVINWSSSDITVVGFIQPNGTLAAVGEGSATIFAECEGVQGTATAQITRAVVALVEIRPGAVELDPGEETDLVATPFDDLGRALAGRDVTFETSDPNVATVTAAGRVTGRALGAATISATIEGIVGRSAVYLLPAPVGVTEIDLGILGGAESVAFGINRHGTVVGLSTTSSGQTRAFRWTTASGIVDLGTLGGAFSAAAAINDNGEIVGGSTGASEVIQAFRWLPGPGMEGLDVAPPGEHSRATAINAAGDIVGAAGTFERGFLRHTTGEVRIIDPLNGFVYSVSNAVNSQRTVVGKSYNDFYYSYSSDPSRAFRWRDGSLDVVTADALHASDVNDAGTIVGVTYASRPFRWTPALSITVLSTLGAESAGAANAINALGLVAGQATGATPHATVWLASGERILLSTMESEATDISDVGWVVGWRKGAGNNRRATLWKIAGVSQP
jgi:probable HAF family extracellular repeat protein